MQRFALSLRMNVRVQFLACVLSAGLIVVPFAGETAAAPAKSDLREKQARQAFAVGRYGDALDLFGALYADTLHPTYLRNIGRCYQNLKQPEKAINAFKDYLRLAKGLLPSERNEIDSYIVEMETMKRHPEPTPAAETPKPATVPVPPPTPKAEPAPVGNVVINLAPIAPPPPPPNPEIASPFYTRGWFWGVVTGVVVVGVIGTLYATGTFAKADPCAGRTCKDLVGDRQ